MSRYIKPGIRLFGKLGGGEQKERKHKQFTVKRAFLIGCGSSTIESKTHVAAGRDDCRKASFRSENSVAARGDVRQKICFLQIFSSALSKP